MNLEAKPRLLVLIFAIVFGLIWLRLVYWQGLKSESMTAAAEQQHFSSLDLPAKRGVIDFSDGSDLVANRMASLLYANLNKLPNERETIAGSLAGVLIKEIPEVGTEAAELEPEEKEVVQKKVLDGLKEKILSRFNLGSTWVNLAHFVSRQTEGEIESWKTPGLGFVPEDTRDYPEASMAAHLLGFVGQDQNGNPKGYFGLEGFYQRELAGRPGQLRLEKDAFGRPIPIGSETRQEKQDGSSLVTTIDRGVQLFTERELEKGISDWKASGGTAIIMSVNSGEILAMASFPRYDPRNFSYYPTNLYKNPAIADLFEPGSIMKPMVMASAINEGAVKPETRCDKCAGPRQIENAYIHTFDNQYHPNETMTEVLINSDNTGMVFVGEKLGFPKLYQYLSRFGFGQKTGVDLEEEAEVPWRPEKDYYPVDRATVTFGQGIYASSLQMVRAIGAIANGGKLVTPHLVKIIKAGGEEIKLPWSEGKQVVSSETAQMVAEMLVRVANESPEHFPKDRIAELASFRISAKSGTAQIAVGGSYKKQGTIASVIGFFPAEKPHFVVLVKLNEPEVRPWGSDTAGPIFFSIIKDLIYYYNISP